MSAVHGAGAFPTNPRELPASGWADPERAAHGGAAPGEDRMRTAVWWLLVAGFLMAGPAAGREVGSAAADAEAMPLDQAREMAVKSPDQRTRLQAVQVLGARGTMAEVPILVQALRDPDEVTRVLAEDALWRVFLRSGDPEADRLSQEGIQRMQRGELGEAVELFSQAVARAPRYAEGYNKRATAYYLMGRFAESLEDCQRTLALNPWHFGALSGEGLVYTRLNRPRRALEAFERALAVHPHLQGARRNAELLREYLATHDRDSL